MASTKRLQEYLQEQQEPFMLHVYLAERGHYLIKCSSTFDTSNGCGLLDSCKRMWKTPKQIDKRSTRNISKHSISLKSNIFSKSKQRVNDKKQVDYPPGDYDDGLFLHQESFELENAEEEKGILFAFLRNKLHSESETKQRMACETQEKSIVTTSSENKKAAKLRSSQLQKAWNSLEHRIILKCQEEKPELQGLNAKASMKNQRMFFETIMLKKNRRKSVEEPEEMIRNMIMMMSKKIVLPWIINSKKIMSMDHSICDLGYVDLLEDWKFCVEECYRDIDKDIGDVIVGDIVQEMILSSI